jgi:hypothetical protein
MYLIFVQCVHEACSTAKLLLALASTVILGSESHGTLSDDSVNHHTLENQSHIATDGQSVSQSVSLGVEPHLGIMTRYLLLFDSYSLVIVGRPL